MDSEEKKNFPLYAWAFEKRSKKVFGSDFINHNVIIYKKDLL